MRRLVSLAACLLLAGCNTFNGAKDAFTRGPREPYTTPSYATAQALRGEIEALGVATALDGVPDCAVPSAGTPTCQVRTIANSTSQIDTYLDRSIFIIDANCSAYLDSLATLGDVSRWTRSQFNTIANYIGVLMALAGQSGESVGYLNAGTGFFNASADNLESLVLVSPTPGKLTPLVRAAQMEKLEGLSSVRQDDSRLQWSSYSRWIEEYATLCTPRGIRGLLDIAIENTADGDTAAELTQASSRVGPQVVAVLSGLPSFRQPAIVDLGPIQSRAALGAFAWRAQPGQTLTKEQTEYIQTRLPPEVYQALQTALADPAQAPYITNLMRGPYSGLLAELRRSEEARYAADSATNDAARAREEARIATERADDLSRRLTQAQRSIETLENAATAAAAARRDGSEADGDADAAPTQTAPAGQTATTSGGAGE